MRRYLGVLLLSTINCGGDMTSATTIPPDTPPAPTDTSGEGRELRAAFPSDLVLSSPTRGPTRGGLSSQEAQTTDTSYAAKRLSLQSMLEGTVPEDCAFRFIALQPRLLDCYGPALEYVNHPDAMFPDPDTIDNDPAGQPNDSDGDGRLPQGDTGIWRENQDSEACAAAVLDSRVSHIESHIDSGILTMASLMCHAHVEGLRIPTDGSTLDLTSVAASGFAANGVALEVSHATVQTTNRSYVTEFVAKRTDEAEESFDIACRLKHRKVDDETGYLGKLSCLIESESPSVSKCRTQASSQTRAFSISYYRNSSSILTYEAKSAEFCGVGIHPWVSSTDYTLDPSPALMDSSNGWVSDYNLARFQFDLNTGAGRYLFSWQAGARDSHSRILTLDLSADSDNTPKSGCAYFGFGPPAQENPARPDGMICNWAGPQNDHTLTDLVQRQCVTWNAGLNLFLSESSRLAINYAPTNSCESNGFDPGGHPFSYSDGVSTVTGTVAQSLVTATEVSDFGVPSPTNVDE